MSNRIKELLTSTSAKNYEIIEKLKIDQSVFYDWKNNAVLPKFDNLIKLADYFGVSVDYLMGRTDDLNEYHTKNLIPFGTNLSNILNNKQITKYRLFKDCNFDTSLKRDWFTNNRKPNVTNLLKMADYLNISMDELMGRVI